MAILAPVLTPRGRLLIAEASEGSALESVPASRLKSAFAKGTGLRLSCLGVDEAGSRLPPKLSHWHEFAARCVAALCALPGTGDATDVAKPALPRRQTRICASWRRARRL